MKSYEANTPRGALGLAAVALTAATLGLAVMLPAATGPSGRVQEIASAASAPGAARARVADATAPALRHIGTIEVTAVRDRNLSSAQESGVPRKRGTQG